MVDRAKNQRFRDYFTSWRSHSAIEEEPFIATAILINNFSSDHDLATAQLALATGDDTVPFSTFAQHEKENNNARAYGTILYCRLAIKDYSVQCAEDLAKNKIERTILNAMSSSLWTLYRFPYLVSSIDTLFTNMNLWLDNHAIHSQNRDLAKTICLSFYTALRVIDLALAGATDKQKDTIGALIDITKTSRDIKSLLVKSAAKITQLGLGIVPAATILGAPLEPVPTSDIISSHFNAQCVAIIEREGPTLSEKLSLMRETLVTTHFHIAALITEKRNNEALHKQINHALLLLATVEVNKSHGGLYALRLINSLADSFENLTTTATGVEERQLAEQLIRRRNQLEAPNLYRRTADSFLYAASLASVIPLTAIRKFTPGFLQRAVAAYVPEGIKHVVKDYTETFDGECKNELETLAKLRLRSLCGTIDITNGKIMEGSLLGQSNKRLKQLRRPLAEGIAEIKPLIKAANVSYLESLLAANVAAYEAITEYETLFDEVTSNKNKLKAATDLSIEIDAFIAQHDGFLVTLSLFFAKLSSIFKTETARMVVEIQSRKTQLQALKTNYQHDFDAGIQQIANNPNLAGTINTSFVAKLTAIENDAAPVVERSKNMVSNYNLIQTMFSTVSRQLPPGEEACDIDASGYTQSPNEI